MHLAAAAPKFGESKYAIARLAHGRRQCSPPQTRHPLAWIAYRSRIGPMAPLRCRWHPCPSGQNLSSSVGNGVEHVYLTLDCGIGLGRLNQLLQRLRVQLTGIELHHGVRCDPDLGAGREAHMATLATFTVDARIEPHLDLDGRHLGEHLFECFQVDLLVLRPDDGSDPHSDCSGECARPRRRLRAVVALAAIVAASALAASARIARISSRNWWC